MVCMSRMARSALVRAVAWAASIAATALPAKAYASADTFGVGDGRDGLLQVTQPDTIINTAFSALSADATQGQSTVTVVAVGQFQVGDLVLIWQSTGLTPPPTSMDGQNRENLECWKPAGAASCYTQAGQWELARIVSTQTTSEAATAGTVTFDGPLLHSYTATDTQVIKVPQYTSVTIDPGASISLVNATSGQDFSWNGTGGGAIAFLSQGPVSNNGAINASANGSRGGAVQNGSLTQLVCPLDDQTPPNAAAVGEGLVPTAYGQQSAGKNNVSDGAGGGLCQQAGGGGGGNGGTGGNGGYASALGTPPDNGGLGGAPLQYTLLDHATFGGGGGAGEENNGAGTSGGAGGGWIFIRGQSLVGNGKISARGGDVSPPSGGMDGQGGGGAGGSVYLRFIGHADCAVVDVSGGNGGSSTGRGVGPGGGGAGGRALLQATPGGTCTINVGCGLAGTQADSNAVGGVNYGATPDVATAGFCQGVTETPLRTGYCTRNTDCATPTPICDTQDGVCVQCMTSMDCMAGQTLSLIHI